MNDISFKDLESWPPAEQAKTKEQETFPCMKCNGTGEYQGVRLHQPKTKCFACNGRGYFKSSAADRAKAKQKRKDKKVQQAADNVKAFAEAKPELFEYLNEVVSWNSFAVSLLQDIGKYGHLTEGQERAAYKMMAKHVDREEAKLKAKAEAEKNAVIVDLTKINEMFTTATGNGLKRPKLRVDKLEIYPAPMNGKNAGYLYVKSDGNYSGKISVEGKFLKSRDCADGVEDTLITVANDPKGSLTNHGRITGQCSCCGRELTNQTSIDMGIGPICAAKYGLI